MKFLLNVMVTCSVLCATSPSPSLASEVNNKIIEIWPSGAPGAENWSGREETTTETLPAGKVILKRNVSTPTLTVFPAATEKRNNTSMLVLPGGAFGALAWDVEGTEIAQWLSERGITAFLLKYRVKSWPVSAGDNVPMSLDDLIKILEPGRKIAVADATQAIKVIRENSDTLEIDRNKVGMIGFSAGAVTTMGVLLESPRKNQPDFAAPIYGMTMISGTPAKDAPPIFIVAAQDDSTIPVQSSIEIFELWNDINRPSALHIYETGGHGFGMRPQGMPIDSWPQEFESWLRSQGLI
ncbi:alpha/beta hydrolase [Microbulbifer sp. SH-1]|uniref:alpha/beta hydrolase n=1 Tax=Microbulbifer sp. SH-1 TaxID=2681547 RepID=UPI00140AAFB0|nr:dienelactone hydrolase family protein [Microbulbifer sp. SH-1]QIL91268.1 alpha/beta hydrolase [Microbulbifer sp. SH-1]